MTDVMGSCNKLTKEKKTHIAVVTEVGCIGLRLFWCRLTPFSCALVQIFKAVTLIAKNGRKPFSQSARYVAVSPL